MDNFFAVLVLLSLLGFIAGLLSPKLVIRWGSKRTRSRVLFIYGLAVIIFLILFGITTPPVEQPREFSKLEITDISCEDGKVSISGITDLPDGSEVDIAFDVAGRLETAPFIGVNTEVKVENGKFTGILTPPNLPAFARGPYVGEVRFSPRGQTDTVLKLVGKDGKNLKGEKVLSPYGYKIMKMSKQTNLQLKLNIFQYPMLNANSFSVDSPERAFAEYLISWQKNDWDRMVKFTEKIWRSDKRDAAEILEATYGFRNLLGAEIIEKKAISNVAADITATVYYAIGKNIFKKKITAKVIREDAFNQLSAGGEWGVNPISTLRED